MKTLDPYKITKNQINKIISVLSNQIPVATISNIASTRQHFYFIVYDAFYNKEYSLRVNRFTGLIEETSTIDDHFKWHTTNLYIDQDLL